MQSPGESLDTVSIEDLHGMRDVAADKARHVTAQLATWKGRIAAYGRRAPDDVWAEYQEWKGRAAAHLSHCNTEISQINAALRRRNALDGNATGRSPRRNVMQQIRAARYLLHCAVEMAALPPMLLLSIQAFLEHDVLPDGLDLDAD